LNCKLKGGLIGINLLNPDPLIGKYLKARFCSEGYLKQAALQLPNR
jgi:hypothetical protein